MSLSNPVVLTSVNDGNGSGVRTSSSISPTAGSLIIVMIAHRAGAGKTITDVDSSFTTSGWNQFIDFNPNQSGDDIRYAVWWANYTSGMGTVSVSVSGNVNRIMFTVTQVTGHDSVTPLVNSAEDSNDNDSGPSTASLTLPSSPASDSLIIGGFTQLGDGAVVVGDDFTEFFDQVESGTYPMTHEGEYRNGGADDVIDWSGLDGSRSAFVAFEVQAGGTPPPVGTGDFFNVL